MTSQPQVEPEVTSPAAPEQPVEAPEPVVVAEPPLELTSITVDLAGIDMSDMLSIGQRIETPTADIYLNAGDPGLVIVDTTMKLRDRTRRVEPLPLTMFMKTIPQDVSAIIASLTSTKETPNE